MKGGIGMKNRATPMANFISYCMVAEDWLFLIHFLLNQDNSVMFTIIIMDQNMSYIGKVQPVRYVD